jgi:hypothetical protein
MSLLAAQISVVQFSQCHCQTMTGFVLALSSNINFDNAIEPSDENIAFKRH